MNFCLKHALTFFLPDLLADPRRLDGHLQLLALRRDEATLVDLGELAVLEVAESRHRGRVHQFRRRQFLLFVDGGERVRNRYV